MVAFHFIPTESSKERAKEIVIAIWLLDPYGMINCMWRLCCFDRKETGTACCLERICQQQASCLKYLIIKKGNRMQYYVKFLLYHMAIVLGDKPIHIFKTKKLIGQKRLNDLFLFLH